MSFNQRLFHTCPRCSTTLMLSVPPTATLSQNYFCDNCSHVSQLPQLHQQQAPTTDPPARSTVEAELSSLLASASLTHRPHLWEPQPAPGPPASPATTASTSAGTSPPQLLSGAQLAERARAARLAPDTAAPRQPVFASAHYTHTAHVGRAAQRSGDASEAEPYIRQGYYVPLAAGDEGRWRGNAWDDGGGGGGAGADGGRPRQDVGDVDMSG